MEKDSLLFSIVIPTYNRGQIIFDTLDSVFSQTYPNLEVIVVDNCSTDDSIELLTPLADKGQIRLIQHKKNYERARSRNTGMENAKGDFLTFLDSDDFLYPTCLEDAAEFSKENPNIKCFHNLYELIDDNKNVIRKYKYPSLENQTKAIVSGNFMSCIGNFIHRDVYSLYRFDTFQDLTGAEDWEFWLRVLADHKLGRINKINGGILHHEGRTVNTQHVEVLERGYDYMFQKFRSDDRMVEVYGSFLNRIEANAYMYLATLANTSGSFDLSKRYLNLARKKDPSVTLGTRYLNTMRRAVFKLQIK